MSRSLTLLLLYFCLYLLLGVSCSRKHFVPLERETIVVDSLVMNTYKEEDGKCFSLMAKRHINEEEHISFQVYTGKDPSILAQFVRDTTILVESGYLEWIREAEPKVVIPNRPFVGAWKRIKTPDNFKTIENVVHSSIVKGEIATQTITKINRVKDGGGLEWREVLCVSLLNDALLMELKESLAQRGYLKDIETIQTFSNPNFLKGLQEYQKDQDMYYGAFSKESINALLYKG